MLFAVAELLVLNTSSSQIFDKIGCKLVLLSNRKSYELSIGAKIGDLE